MRQTPTPSHSKTLGEFQYLSSSSNLVQETKDQGRREKTGFYGERKPLVPSSMINGEV